MIRAALIAASLFGFASCAEGQPNLILTGDGVEALRAAETRPELIDRSYELAMRRVEASLDAGLIVPVPADPGGGYTHERHKENYKIIHDAGLLYQITGDARYLDHAEAYLLAYADMYRPSAAPAATRPGAGPALLAKPQRGCLDGLFDPGL